MAAYATQRTVSLPRERAYESWLDGMNLLHRLEPERFREFRVLSQKDGERVTFCKEVWKGKTYAYTTREQLSRPSGATQTVIAGNGKGSVSRWTFEPVTNGTRIKVEHRLKGGMGLLLVLFRKEFAKEFEGALDRWQKAIEAAS